MFVKWSIVYFSLLDFWDCSLPQRPPSSSLNTSIFIITSSLFFFSYLFFLVTQNHAYDIKNCIITQNAPIHARIVNHYYCALSLSLFLSFPLTHIFFLFFYSLFLSFLGCKDLTRVIRSSRLIFKKHDDYYCNVNVFSNILVTHILMCRANITLYLKKAGSVINMII